MTVPTILLLVISASAQASTDSHGTVVSTVQRVEIQRGDQRYEASHQAGLAVGDRITTAGGGAASFVLHGGAVVHLGPSTTVALVNGKRGLVIRVDGGEARVTAPGDRGVVVATRTAEATIVRGILRVGVSQAGTRVWSETGRATVRDLRNQEATEFSRRTVTPAAYYAADPVQLGAGQEMRIPMLGEVTGPGAATGKGWTINTGQLNLRGAIAASRYRKRGHADRSHDRDIALYRRDRSDEPYTQDDAAQPSGRNSEGQDNISTLANVSLGLGGFSGSTGTSSGGGNLDFAQGAFQNSTSDAPANMADGTPIPTGSLFRGRVHVVTAQNLTTIDVRLDASEIPTAQYWSISDSGSKAANLIKITENGGGGFTEIKAHDTLPIDGFSSFAVNYGDTIKVDDPKSDDFLIFQSKLSGNGAALSGAVMGATPQKNFDIDLLDIDAGRTDPDALNSKLTHVLGVFLLRKSAEGKLEIGIRRSDQDRLVKGNNLLNATVTPNPAVTFRDATVNDPFSIPGDLVPVTFDRTPTIESIGTEGRAALTTIMADSLFNFSNRTKQRRFVVDGRIIDISGYRKK